MKKWLIIGLLSAVGIVGALTGLSLLQVRANDTALEEIRGQQGVIVLAVEGMT